jgi:hypothetical protein
MKYSANWLILLSGITACGEGEAEKYLLAHAKQILTDNGDYFERGNGFDARLELNRRVGR